MRACPLPKIFLPPRAVAAAVADELLELRDGLDPALLLDVASMASSGVK
jgi:hypothetical protein